MSSQLTLTQVLGLVGKLDDSLGEDTPRERFRKYLEANVNAVGILRDYVEECVRNSGDQYNRALQDLVNHIGKLLKFEVRFGRYQGVQGQIGFDGLWKSPTGFHLVAEVKTTETYAIKTSVLIGYVDTLISERMIPDRDSAIGLYVIGRPDPELQQLEKTIIAEKRVDQLRIISVENLLSLAEMINTYDVKHEDILAILRPSGPSIDLTVGVMRRLVAQPQVEEPATNVGEVRKESQGEASYWVTPVSSDEHGEPTAEQVVRQLVGERKIYAFGDNTPGRKALKPGDWLCFYASEKGVIAHARVASKPERSPDANDEDYPWVFKLDSASIYGAQPVIIDVNLRSRLDKFHDRSPTGSWGWFVQTTHQISEHDFKVLTRQGE